MRSLYFISRFRSGIAVVILGLICAFPAWSQPSGNNIDESLAAQYYGAGDFDRAAVLYKKLLDANQTNTFYYSQYLASLLGLKDYPRAEKDLRALLKRAKGAQADYYSIDLAHVLSLKGDEPGANKVLDDLVKNLPPDVNRITAVGAALRRRDRFDYALKVYENARKSLRDNHAYAYELADLYAGQKRYEETFAEYLSLIEYGASDYEDIRGRMQELVSGNEDAFDVLRKTLLRKAQLNPDDPYPVDMLAWLFVQRKDFSSALVQVKALDKRRQEGGRRLVELAKTASDNGDYEVASQAIAQVIDAGQNQGYYVQALRVSLDLQYARIVKQGTYSPTDVSTLTAAYEDFLKNYSMARPESGEIVLRLAEVYARYGNDVPRALSLLTSYVGIKGIDRFAQGKAKLALADLTLLTGDTWESTLLYGQVEKTFENDILGHEAKFRNARLSFYRGEFDWALAQLDVLKESTSELIANDALALAMLIQDNIGLDSTKAPMLLYAEADFAYYKGLYSLASSKLDTLARNFPKHSLGDDLLFLQAKLASAQKNYGKATSYYDSVYQTYGKDILADDALYANAMMHEVAMNDKVKAQALYEKIILEYPGSVFGIDARKRYRALRGDGI